MKVYQYKNYEQYVKCQKEANEKKALNVWAVEGNISFIAGLLLRHNYKKGLCHGVRQGHEVRWFKKYFDDMLGTEIGNVKECNVVKWDFNKENKEWINEFDFIYSNSFDHSFDPEQTLKVWWDQIKPGGCIVLEYDRRQEHTGEISKAVNKTDPVSIKITEIKKLIRKWIPDAKVKIIDLPVIKIDFQKAVIIKKP